MQIVRVTEPLSFYTPFRRGDSPISPIVLRNKAELGTRVHDACSAFALSLYRKVEIDVQGYYESFLSWFEKYVLDVLLVEKRLTSKLYGLSGELDFLLRLAGIDTLPCIAVVDIKTPIAKSMTWMGQVTAYHYLAEHETEYTKIERAGALRLDPFGGQAKMSWVPNLAHEWNYYLCGLSAYRHYILGE